MGGRTIGIRNLDRIFDPKRIAVIGASDEVGTIGNTLITNLIGSGYKGVVYPVSKDEESIHGVHAFNSIFEVPKIVDLALISVPDDEVEATVMECAESGAGGAIIYSPLRSGTALGVTFSKVDKLVDEVSKEYGMRVLGPNTFGFIRPHIDLNAGILRTNAMRGNVAFVSQSNTLFPAILDWCAYKGVGFSGLVSVGNMVDVTFADLIEYFGMDPKTRSIMLYVEAMCDMRAFMGAARHFAKTKPIIVVKAARFSESAIVAESHTGTLTTYDDLYDAAFKRAGILRVDGIQELFNCSSALAMQPRPTGKSVAIITNAGGPAIMCADTILEKGGNMALLSDETKAAIDELVGEDWNHANPLTLHRDASPEVYGGVLKVLQEDASVNGIIVVHTTSDERHATRVAEAIGKASSARRNKPILAAWVGRDTMRTGRHILEQMGVPTFDLSEKAATTFLYTYQYGRNLDDLYETPEDILTGFTPDKDRVRAIIDGLVAGDRPTLTEYEALQVLDAYDIPVVESRLVQDKDQCIEAAKAVGCPVALKVVSPQILHKSEVGGVILNVGSEEGARTAFGQILKDAKKFRPDAKVDGILVQPMVSGLGYEVIIGVKRDACFGPSVLFGAGGVMVELIKDRSLGFPPLNQALASRMISDTQMASVLDGFRGRPPAKLRLLHEAIVKVSYLSIDFPELLEMDINPVYIDDTRLVALDARMVVDLTRVKNPITPGSDLIISRYPTGYNTTWKAKDGTPVTMRAIRPEDEPRWRELLESLSHEAIRNRFFAPVRQIDKDMVVAYCHIDYDREMAITMNVTEEGRERMVGVGRIILDHPTPGTSEFAVVVLDRYQGRGLGSKLLDTLKQIGRDRGMRFIWGDVLSDNEDMLRLCQRKGFRIWTDGEMDTDTYRLTLDLRPS